LTNSSSGDKELQLTNSKLLAQLQLTNSSSGASSYAPSPAAMGEPGPGQDVARASSYGPARPRRLSGLSVSLVLCKSVFVWRFCMGVHGA
jgi:hypothetical protein